MLKQETVYLGLGSNIDDRKKYIQTAKKELKKLKIDIVKESPLYRSPPLGGPKGQSPYLNQVVKIKTSLTPLKLLFFVKNVEAKLGRINRGKWGAREIDLDILFYNDIILNADELMIPHPEMIKRKFVLKPFTDIDPDMVHPVEKLTVAELLKKCPDKSRITKIK